MGRNTHRYMVELQWMGRAPGEPWDYQSYSRAYTTRVTGKPDLPGSADPAFRGDRARHNPEDLFVAAISACHMLSYLALCAREGVEVTHYGDQATGELELEPGGGGRFNSVDLRPTIALAPGADPELATQLHGRAHQQCFIASSCGIPIRCHPSVVVEATEGRNER